MALTETEKSAPLPLTRPFSAGRLQVQLATEDWQLRGAQALRYRSLYLEAGGVAKPEWSEAGREFDEWDPYAWHVVVTDSRRSGEDSVVGTLRLTANDALPPGLAFYTEHAYDVSALRQRYPKMLELSRFCIDSQGRSGSILLVIWRFTMQLIVENGFDVMLGCASFKGTDVASHTPILSWLYQHNLAPAELMPVPRLANAVRISDHYQPRPEEGEAMREVPTLLRGYLKIGARISDTAIQDHQFNTTFVCIYVDASEMVAGQHKLVSGGHV